MIVALNLELRQRLAGIPPVWEHGGLHLLDDLQAQTQVPVGQRRSRYRHGRGAATCVPGTLNGVTTPRVSPCSVMTTRRLPRGNVPVAI